MVGVALFCFLLLGTMVNCLFSPSLRVATLLDYEMWRVRAVPSMTLTGGTPCAVQMGCAVVSFVGSGAGFV